MMKIFPAIDLINGQCVRLEKGRFDSKTEYSSDPVAMAKSFKEAGAKFLHVVDLDGAKTGGLKQGKLISEIAKTSGLSVQAGGGVRTEEDCQLLLENGVDRIVIGSLAVKSPDLVEGFFKKFGPDRITLALDVNIDDSGIPKVATQGWQEQGSVSVSEIIDRFSNVGLSAVLCTDISRDGMLQGPNTDLYKNLLEEFPAINWIASGGVGSIPHISECQSIGMDGLIIGKALYENKFTIEEALSC
jgi:phosphoribosylformimino-5-aminoimidazole carboxamide ribotide isomerase